MMSKLCRALMGAFATVVFAGTVAAAEISAPLLDAAPKIASTIPGDLLPGRISQQSEWRIAQDVSEKEAFDLAKDANSIQVWEAYLIKFPNGFRAAIAKSYINKLRADSGADGSTGGGSGTQPGYAGDEQTYGDGDEIQASEFPGPYRIAARGMSKVYVNNTRPGLVTVRPNALDRRSGHWEFEQVRGTKYIRIRNTWKGTYLHLDGQSVQSHRRPRGDRSTHWTLERASDGSDHVVLRNRQKGWYLWTDADDRFLYVAKGRTDGPRGHWRLVSMEQSVRYEDDEDDYDEPDTRPTKPRLTCTNGYVKNGSCRCRSGRERVRIGRNKYRCNRVRTSCNRNMYYSKSRKRCVCKRGYERVGSKCYRNEELDDDRGNTSCPKGFLLRKGSCVCPRGKKNIRGKCRRPKSGGGSVKPRKRCSAIKFAFTRGNTCKCAGGRIFTGTRCILPD